MGCSVSTPRNCRGGDQGRQHSRYLQPCTLHSRGPRLDAVGQDCVRSGGWGPVCPWGVRAGSSDRQVDYRGKMPCPDASLVGSRTARPHSWCSCCPGAHGGPPAPLGAAQHLWGTGFSRAHRQWCRDERLPRPYPADGGSRVRGTASSWWHLPPPMHPSPALLLPAAAPWVQRVGAALRVGSV